VRSLNESSVHDTCDREANPRHINVYYITYTNDFDDSGRNNAATQRTSPVIFWRSHSRRCLQRCSCTKTRSCTCPWQHGGRWVWKGGTVEVSHAGAFREYTQAPRVCSQHHQVTRYGDGNSLYSPARAVTRTARRRGLRLLHGSAGARVTARTRRACHGGTRRMRGERGRDGKIKKKGEPPQKRRVHTTWRKPSASRVSGPWNTTTALGQARPKSLTLT